MLTLTRTPLVADNLINGSHACGNNGTLNRFLKGVGGFDGLVMTDWNAVRQASALTKRRTRSPFCSQLGAVNYLELLDNGR